MSETIRTARNTAQSPTSLSIETLEEIVRNCQRNEDRLHELERHTRHERKKAERLLQETYRAIENRDSRNTSSIIEQNTTNDNSHVDDQQPKQHSSKEFFVPLDDDDDDDDHDENKKPRHRQTNNNNSNNNKTSQDKHLLERVEKLLAGDGTTTASSDVMSSQERQRKVVEKPTSPVEDDLDDRFLNINEETFLNARQLPSACSIDYELSTTDRLLSERTPINNQRIKTDNRPNETNIKPTEPQDEIKFAGDDRDRQFYERLNNYVKTGRFVSPDPDKQNPRPTTTTTTSDDETYQYKYPSKRKRN